MLVYPGAGVHEMTHSSCVPLRLCTLVPGYSSTAAPQLAAAVASAVAGPIRILRQYESFYTNPYLCDTFLHNPRLEKH